MRLKAAFLLGAVLAMPAAAETVGRKHLAEPPKHLTALPLTVVGRAALSEDHLSIDTSWPLSGAEAWFDGDEVVLRLDDKPARFSVLIDGREVADLGHPVETVTIRDIAPAATPGHHIEIVQYNETLAQSGHILGVYAATPLPPPSRAVKGQLEVIGDSWTSGYGDRSKSHFCSKKRLSDTTDARITWGPAVARNLGLDMHMAAYSGIGIVRNYGGSDPGHTMPAIYDDATFTDKRPYDDTGWSPRLIIISLGGNDFETILSDSETWHSLDDLRGDFITTYEAFLRHLRTRYPKAGLVMMNYGETEVTAATAKIIAQLNSEGETRIASYTAAGPFEQTGCDWHLNSHDYNKIADGMTTWLNQHPDLWQGED